MSGSASNVKDRPPFHPGMLIGDAMKVHPDVQLVFKSYQLGGCAHCSINTMETIEQACQAYGIQLDLLIESLNNLLDE